MMKRGTRRVLGTLATMTLTLAATASAQTAATLPQPLAERYVDTETGVSLADAIANAVEREPRLRAARAELDIARGMRQQAALRPNPSVMFERREEPAGTDNQTTMQLSVPLDLFRRSRRIQAADREVDAVDRSIADRVRMVVNDVKLRYGQAAAAVRDLAVADNAAISARRELELVQRRVEEGASPPLDRSRLDVERRRLESNRLMAASRADVAMFELKRALGLSADAPLILREPIEALAGNSMADTAAPPAERPDILEAEARVRVADARIDRAAAEARFDVTLFGSHMRTDAGFPQRGFADNGDLERVRGVFHYLSGGAMVMIPLGNRNQGEIAAARAERTVAEARLEAARLARELEVAAAIAQVTQTRQALDVMSDGVDLARQNLDVMRQTYELGRATLAEVLEEQRRYLQFETEYTTALRNAFEARASLDFARGELR